MSKLNVAWILEWTWKAACDGSQLSLHYAASQSNLIAARIHSFIQPQSSWCAKCGRGYDHSGWSGIRSLGGHIGAQLSGMLDCNCNYILYQKKPNPEAGIHVLCAFVQR
jgi:hypothetical protein